MATVNFDGGASPSVTTSWTGWGGVDSTGGDGVDLPTTGNLAFNGNKPVYVTNVVFYIAGRGGSRSIRVAIDGQYSSYKTIASGSAATAQTFSLAKVWQNGGSNLQTRIDENGTSGFYFGRGADGTGESTDDNGGTWTGSLSGSATYYYVPTAPTIGTAIQDGVSQDVNLTWSAPSSDGGTAITGYRIHYSTSSSFASYTSIETGSTATSYKVTGLTYGQTYYFRVMAINATATAAGTSSVASGTASATLVIPGTDGWETYGTVANTYTNFTRQAITLLNGSNKVALSKYRDVVNSASPVTITANTSGIQRVLTGLEVGRVYKVNMTCLVETTVGNIYRVLVQGKTAGANTTVAHISSSNGTAMPEYSFTATATSHTLQVELAETITGSYVLEMLYVFDLTVTRVAEDLTVTKGYWIQDNEYNGTLANHYDLTMNSIGGYWWVDKTNKTKFEQDTSYTINLGTFTDGQELVGGVLTPGQSIPGELHYKDIQVGYDTASVVNDITISNEGLAPYQGNDTLPRAWQASWNQVDSTSQDNWGTRKTELQTNLWLSSLDNLITNPSFEVNLDTTTNKTGTTNSAFKQVTTTVPTGIAGSKALQHKVKVADTTIDLFVGDSVVGNGGDYNGIIAGNTYSAKAYVRKTTATANARATIQIQFYNEDNVLLALAVSVYTTLTNTNQWYEVTQTFVAPAGAVSALVHPVVNLSTGGTVPVGAKFQWDGLSLVAGSTPVYFDGDTPDTTSYIYDWLGSQQESMSRRSVNRLYTRATDILTDFANPQVVIKSFTWNAAEDPIVAGKLDVGSIVTLKFNGTEADYRVAGLEHDITPEEWLITVQVQKAS